MAVDLQAIANMHANIKAQKEAKRENFKETLFKIAETNNLRNKKITAVEAGAVDSYLKTLNYNSSDAQIDSAYEMNNEWLANANSRETNSKDRQLNQAIYESKNHFDSDVANPETDTTDDDFQQDVKIQVAEIVIKE